MDEQRLKGFTLIELLVVIAIISSLMGLLLPPLSRAREQARRVACQGHLHAMGQAIYLYGNDNNDRLPPGDHYVDWFAWADRPVNLGHLLSQNYLPIPTRKKNIVFCPSIRNPDGSPPLESFQTGWGQTTSAPISYMYNTSLDGEAELAENGRYPILAHKNRINFLMGDSSVHSFFAPRLVYDDEIGPELFPDTCARHQVNFPVAMLHGWLEKDDINVVEARDYLADPTAWWDERAANPPSTRRAVMLSLTSQRSLVSDMAGVWADQSGCSPPAVGGG